MVDGRVLSHASSHYGTKPRWTELTIYECDGENGSTYYVVAGVGRSVVYHQSGCPSLTTPNLHPEAPHGGLPCFDCQPHQVDDAVVYEVDRTWEKDADCAWELIDQLRTENWDRPGTWTLSKLALRSLSEAARIDPNIRHALTRTIGTAIYTGAHR